MASSVCFYFQIHQPWRITPKHAFEKELCFKGDAESNNKDVFLKVTRKSYTPAFETLGKMLEKYPEFCFALSITGTWCQQAEQFAPELIEKLQELVKTGRVEILAETFYHSLAFLYSKKEWAEQIMLHRQKMQKLFGITPTIFRNTELIYRDDLAQMAKTMGFHGMIAEGWKTDPTHLHTAYSMMLPESDFTIAKHYTLPETLQKPAKKTENNEEIPFLVLTKHYELSDDMAFRFGDKNWKEYPLTAEKFTNWIHKTEGDTVNLFMDFETLGEHQWEDTGIFNFLYHIPEHFQALGGTFRTPTSTLQTFEAKKQYHAPDYISWADEARNLSAWAENALQNRTIERLKNLEAIIFTKGTPNQIESFRRLSTSDHVYYMSTKYWADGDVHAYFSPYKTPYDAFLFIMHALDALEKELV